MLAASADRFRPSVMTTAAHDASETDEVVMECKSGAEEGRGNEGKDNGDG